MEPVIAAAVRGQSLPARIRIEGDSLYLDYEAVSSGSGYVAPSVMLEFGARSTGEPASIRDVGCDAAGHVDGVEFPKASPRVMHAERTFWEKATAIHVFCLQERPAAIGSRATGMTSSGWTMPVLPTRLLLTGSLPMRWRNTNPCSLRKGGRPVTDRLRRSRRRSSGSDTVRRWSPRAQ